jgi:outer membrane protein OmpA-like peptidoglycan-associated protein
MKPLCLVFNVKRASCVAVFTLLSSLAAAQDHSYTKENLRYQYARYKQHDNRLANACQVLGRKRNHSARTRSRNPSIDNKGRILSASVGVKPLFIPTIVPEVTPEPLVSDQELTLLHGKEDNVLAQNKLPVPTSQKHEDIRSRVEEDLRKNPLNEPRPLSPLYFQFNQDEFSVVDMDPFLIAVEYALQGRHVLVEGHTDNRGQDDFNVKLSVKRVQRIRQLMLDMGVPDDHISIIGYGEEHVKDGKNKNEDIHQNDRRVDFTVF